MPAASQSDVIDPARANAMMAALGNPLRFETGNPLPPFFHQLYFWDARAPVALGPDGHPATGGLIPDLGLPRRMWAGGRLRFHMPLRAGIPASRTSVCESGVRKQGRSGALGLVTLRHDITQEDGLCLTEWQDLIYRAPADPAAPAPVPPVAPVDEEVATVVEFSTTLLFRYSALTFNGHRIHYDESYARQCEGYKGLVVHGPLLAQLLMLFAREHLGTVMRFDFRATSALMHHESAELCLKGRTLWVRAQDGRQCMTASCLSE